MSELIPATAPLVTEYAESVGTVLRAADRIRRQLTAAMEPFGITGQQYNVLRILRGAHPHVLPTLEIAARMLEQTPGITRLLDRLEMKGLVSRHRLGRDRRQVMCSVTPAGLELLAAMEPAVAATNAQALARLDSEALKTLWALLEAISAERG